MNTQTVALTGVKPSGELHLGNFAGAIRPLARSAARPGRETFVFVADLRSLTTRPDPRRLRERTRALIAALIACGLDGDRVHIFRQSRIPQITQISALLANVCPKGVLNRAHAYKAAVTANVRAGRDPDHGINAGLFAYPVLMAADILALRADEVPVGADQAQHLETAVDLARAFARRYRPGVIAEPRPLINAEVATLPGLDGGKMSKSYGNTIPLFAPERQQRRLIDRIVTDSRRPEDPKDPEQCTVVALLDAFADPHTRAEVRAAYRAGGLGYGAAKAILADAVTCTVGPLRKRYETLLAAPERLDERLGAGEQHAARRAAGTLAAMHDAMGL
ncbi:MAG: tryptophan--tRNA ligase [Actinomycetota bacterium]|nr:tryptophan--tRNA ligase [Actinomycetota bacterium]